MQDSFALCCRGQPNLTALKRAIAAVKIIKTGRQLCTYFGPSTIPIYKGSNERIAVIQYAGIEHPLLR